MPGRLSRAESISALRRMARRRLPRPIFDYLDGGADDEVTLRRNLSAFNDYGFLPEALTDVSTLTTATRLFGREVRWPLMLSPTGLNRLFHPEGELAVARAAAASGLMHGLSTLATTRLEAVAEASTGPKVFQIYMFKDRGLTFEFVQRCKAAGYDGLVLTVDTQVTGNRERDVRHGLSLPPRLTLKSALSFGLHPAWCQSALRHGAVDFPNVSHRVVSLSKRSTPLFAYVDSQFDRSVTWKDIDALAAAWGGPLSIKGVMTAADARRARDHGASGVMVSNHGGRQLDGLPAPIQRIADIRDALGAGLEVICDGGVRRGSDVVKALALGADACSIGRPYLFGLAAGGQAGVQRAIDILRSEFERTLALLGVADSHTLGRTHVQDLNRSVVMTKGWRGDIAA